MTDLEIMRLCAEAMDFAECRERDKSPFGERKYRFEVKNPTAGWALYDPLHDDAQAMALVKRFMLQLTMQDWTKPNWQATYGQSNFYGISPDLNRAICECVAKMQQAKK